MYVASLAWGRGGANVISISAPFGGRWLDFTDIRRPYASLMADQRRSCLCGVGRVPASVGRHQTFGRARRTAALFSFALRRGYLSTRVDCPDVLRRP
jgi:hypothetical protein